MKKKLFCLRLFLSCAFLLTRPPLPQPVRPAATAL